MLVLRHRILQLVLFKSNNRDQGSKCQDSEIVPWEVVLEGLLQRWKGQFGTRTLPSGSGSPFFAIEEHPTPVPCCPGRPLHCVRGGAVLLQRCLGAPIRVKSYHGPRKQ